MQGYELYELSLKQEVLTEKAAGILGDTIRCIYHLDPQNMAKQKDDITAVNVLDAIYESVWLLKHNTALAKTERELEIINNQLDFAADTVKRVSQVVFEKVKETTDEENIEEYDKAAVDTVVALETAFIGKSEDSGSPSPVSAGEDSPVEKL